MNRLNTLSITVMLFAAAVGGFAAYGYFSGLFSGYFDSERTEELRPAGTVSVDPQIKRRPSFSLNDPWGVLVSSEEWEGKPLIINFWATWCAPCRREIPLLKKLSARNSERNLQVVGVALDIAEAVAEYSDEMQIDYPVLVGDQDAMDVAEAFGLDLIVLPATAVSDSSGHIITIHIGELHPEQAEIVLDVLWRVEAGDISPDDGRNEIDRRLEALDELRLATN